MAITQVGSATSDSVGNGASITMTKPTGVTSGDVLIAVLVQNENSFSLPSGFTLIREVTTTETTGTWSAHAYYKVCGGSEPASYSFDNGDATAPIAGVLSAWRGVNNSTPINTSAELAEDGVAETSPVPTGPTVTTTTGNRRICVRACRSVSPQTVVTFSSATSGWSELGEAGGTSTGSVRYSICQYARTADDAAGSNQTTAAITASQTETNNGWFHIALESASVPVNASGGTATPSTTANKPTPAVKTRPTVIG